MARELRELIREMRNCAGEWDIGTTRATLTGLADKFERALAASTDNEVDQYRDRIPAESLGRDADGVEALAAWGYESISGRLPPANATVVYWHRQEDGPGFPAIADEWSDEHHAAHAVAWHPGASGLARRLRPTVDASTAERRARELLAAEYDREGLSSIASDIRTDVMLTRMQARAIRALTAALNPETDTHE